MKNQHILTFCRKISHVPFTHQDSYTYCPEKGWKVLQKISLWLLRKLECFHSSLHEEVSYVQCDKDTLIESIIKQEREVWEACGHAPERVYIGRDDFMEILSLRECPHDFFSIGVDYEIGVDRKVYRIRGMPVSVVPWMRGVLVVPKED